MYIYMVYRRKKRGGTKGVVDVPALQSYGDAGNPSASAAAATATTAQNQNKLNNTMSGGKGCPQSSTIPVVTFPASSASPVDASSNANNITQTLAQAQTDNAGDTVGGGKEKPLFPAMNSRQNRRRKRSRARRSKSRRSKSRRGGARRSKSRRSKGRRSKGRRSGARRKTRRRRGGNWGCFS